MVISVHTAGVPEILSRMTLLSRGAYALSVRNLHVGGNRCVRSCFRHIAGFLRLDEGWNVHYSTASGKIRARKTSLHRSNGKPRRVSPRSDLPQIRRPKVDCLGWTIFVALRWRRDVPVAIISASGRRGMAAWRHQTYLTDLPFRCSKSTLFSLQMNSINSVSGIKCACSVTVQGFV
jgi:hypothetical protein